MPRGRLQRRHQHRPRQRPDRPTPEHVSNPRGGVRHVIPSKGDYLADKLLSSGGDDPLLPHLRLDLSKAERVDIAVAFVKHSGVERLYADLDQALERDAQLRLVTGDYLDITDPDALVRLLDLAALHPRSRVELRAFRAADTSFHPKSYVFHLPDGSGVAYVGSSNLSKSALEGGVEWNYRVITSRDQQGFSAVTRAFDALFAHRNTVPIDADWVDAYRQRRRPPATHHAEDADDVAEEREAPPPPNPVQREALEALLQTRLEGNSAGLVVLATGLGKTWLSAFDSARPDFKRVLFVAHREEILGQALATYRRIRPESRLGQYNGEVLFASRRSASARTWTSSARTRSTTSSSTSSTTPPRRRTGASSSTSVPGSSSA